MNYRKVLLCFSVSFGLMYCVWCFARMLIMSGNMLRVPMFIGCLEVSCMASMRIIYFAPI